MATNIIQEPGWNYPVVCSKPTTPVAGDPVRFGAFTGIALTNEGAGGNIATETTVYFGPCIVDVSVKGTDGSPSAVAVGDTIFYVDDATPPLSKTASGTFFGFALETVESDATATIQVMKPATPGGGTLASGGVGTTQLANNAVTAAKLTATMQKGFIPLPLTGWREIASNDIPATAADAGALSSNTTPILGRVNGATDKQLRLTWASSNNDEITFGGIVYPPDLDDAAAVTVHVMAAMAGATDTPVLGISYWEGVGDSNAGGNTAAVTGTTAAEYSVSIAHGDVGAHPKAVTVGIIPAAHTTDALYIYGAWIEYTRK